MYKENLPYHRMHQERHDKDKEGIELQQFDPVKPQLGPVLRFYCNLLKGLQAFYQMASNSSFS